MIVLVVPCYNEETRLNQRAFSNFLEAHPEISIRFVDDGSKDATAELLDGFAMGHSGQVRVTHLPANQGKAEAVRIGVMEELLADAQVVGYWDADLATPLEDAPRFSQFLLSHPTAEVVLGSRVRMLGHPVERKPMRHYVGRGFATAASLVLRLATYDTQCGAKLFRNTEVVREAWSRKFTTNWIFDVELIARLCVLYRERGWVDPERFIAEHPVSSWRDVAGSKLTTSSFFEAAVDLVRIEREYGGRLGGRFGQLNRLFVGDAVRPKGVTR